MKETHQSVIEFWFHKTSRACWFKSSTEFDDLIRCRFGDLLQQASRAELYAWRETPLGRLAEIIILDQFSRNVYRGTAQAFSQDSMSLALAQEAILRGDDASLTAEQRSFLYMPYMHSESAVIHELALQLFNSPGLEMNLRYEKKHKAIIDRFGRYPHRNALLGRNSTQEEIEFLQGPDSGF